MPDHEDPVTVVFTREEARVVSEVMELARRVHGAIDGRSPKDLTAYSAHLKIARARYPERTEGGPCLERTKRGHPCCYEAGHTSPCRCLCCDHRTARPLATKAGG